MNHYAQNTENQKNVMQNTISDYKDDITTGRKLDLIKVFGAVTVQAIKEKRAAYVNSYVCFILSI